MKTSLHSAAGQNFFCRDIPGKGHLTTFENGLICKNIQSGLYYKVSGEKMPFSGSICSIMNVNDFLLNISELFIYPLIAFVISLTLTALCIKILPKLGFIDNPGGRHIHVRAVPRGGGIAVVLSVFLTVLAYAAASRDALGIVILKSSILPGAIIFLTGLIDDRIGMRSIVKLIAQILAAVLLWYGFDRDLTICGWVLHRYVSLIITVLWVVGVINAFNMVDGLDGLAAGLAAISGGCLTVWFLLRGSPMALYTLIFVGACLGFLRYNFAPAQIFLGDTGSMFLGMFLAIAGAGTLDYTATFTSLLLPPLIIGVPVFDMLLALWRRSIRKKLNNGASGLMDADSDHLHHRLLRRSGTHSRAAGKMYVLSLCFAFLAITLLLMRDRAAAAAFILLVMVGLVILRNLAVVELYDSVVFLRKSLLKMRKNLLFVAVHPVLDVLMTGFSAALFCFVLWNTVYWKFVLYSIFPVMMVLIVSGTYRVFWLRAAMRDRIKLFLNAVAGSALAVFFLCLYRVYKNIDCINLEFISGAAMFILLTASLISFERFILCYIESAWINYFVSQYVPEDSRRILLVGSGLYLRLSMMYLGCSRFTGQADRAVGFVSESPEVFPGLRCYGSTMLGRIGEISEIFAANPFDRVVIAGEKLSEEQRRQIMEFCVGKGIGCSEFLIPESGIVPEDDIPRDGKISPRVPWVFFDFIYLLAVSTLSSFLNGGVISMFYICCGTLLPLAVFAFAGCYKISLWRMAGVKERWNLIRWSLGSGIVVQILLMIFQVYIAGKTIDWMHFLSGAMVYMMLLCGGVQLFRLFLHPAVYHGLRGEKSTSPPVMLLGSGVHCRIFLQYLAADHSAGKPNVAGIIDDDSVLHGLRCLGLPVLGGCDDLDGIYEKVRFSGIIVTANHISGENMQKVREFCARNKVECASFCVEEKDMTPQNG